MLIYLIIIFSIYFGFLSACIVGWQKFTRQSKSRIGLQNVFVSVVIAVRNEETSIAPLLASLRFQDFPYSNFEIIFVDDHSTDNIGQIITSYLKDNPHLKSCYFHSPSHGKKLALTEGIQRAQGEIILTTDADCVLPTDWISKMVMSFDADTTMIIGLVKIQEEKSLFSKLQAHEFNSVIGSGMAIHSFGFPVMCNGASLAFRKKSFDAVNGYEGNLHVPSGDDEFLMRKLNERFPRTIQTIHWPSVVVATTPQPSLKSFIHQRLRWAGKWRANESLTTKVLALYIFIFQATCIVAFGLLFTTKYLVGVSALMSMKLLLEGYFLFNMSRTLHQRFSVPSFLLLQLVYPFYVLIIGIFSQLVDYEWKGRREQSIG